MFEGRGGDIKCLVLYLYGPLGIFEKPPIALFSKYSE